MKIFTLNCKGKLLTISKPVVMGILNVTPDSFFDGGKYSSENSILKHTEQMLLEGAAIIDIGGQSTRPGAKTVSQEEELKRVLEAVRLIHKKIPEAILSIDTFHSKIAEAVIAEGVSIINDISGGTADEKIFVVAAKYDCPVVIMHRKGNTETMHQPVVYTDLMCEIMDHFIRQIAIAKRNGVKDIIIDPGFGFSKSLEENYALLKNMHVLEQLDRPLLAGLSRKSMLSKLLLIKTEDSLNATSIVNMVALQNGAAILRVHDVKEAMECIRIYEQLD